jgi:hypothetical protein
MAEGMRRIATEEAFSIPEHLAAMLALSKSTWDTLDLRLPRRSAVPGSPLYNGLTDVEDERLKIMDENGVSMHLLSLTSPACRCSMPISPAKWLRSPTIAWPKWCSATPRALPRSRPSRRRIPNAP